ncbi:MarR family winged helix-turn-helix transcriptional regulator [Amycolatopsis sp. CA-230715]|uniref:MarR family winged helix-turn-helix transcriptional regulator n=1 Tax=Amycolatopsis sp. CA-230715 TaxID=2745196 RepID=UPI001C3238B4|nr:MarR family transcriptional regulator [Amycolatopsis sp. CA-230715]QWF84764.1 hypothetical protein HUW46_08216 [Amycolatopsis sp. CA-230715]
MGRTEAEEMAEHRERLVEGLRSFGASYTELTRRFAGFLGLHATDAAALAEILYAEDKGVPLSPARLAERVSLTSGATTNLLNRLERAGHVVRIRDQADRRVVTLRASREIQGPAQEFFGGLLVSPIDALIAQYPVEKLEEFEEFLARLRVTMREVLAEE